MRRHDGPERGGTCPTGVFVISGLLYNTMVYLKVCGTGRLVHAVTRLPSCFAKTLIPTRRNRVRE